MTANRIPGVDVWGDEVFIEQSPDQANAVHLYLMWAINPDGQKSVGSSVYPNTLILIRAAAQGYSNHGTQPCEQQEDNQYRSFDDFSSWNQEPKTKQNDQDSKSNKHPN